MRIKELRAKAREDLKGNFWKIFIPFFLMTVFFYFVGRIPEWIPGGNTVKIIVGLLLVIFTIYIAISASYALVIRTIKIGRKEEVGSFFSDMFGEGTKNGFSCAWGLFKKLWYWGVLAIIGYALMIAGMIQSASTYFSTSSAEVAISNPSPLGSILSIGGLILFFASIIILVVKNYDYYIITYLKHDYPEKSTKELLGKSKEMMLGNKAKAFVIPLTFIGWLLLAALVGGIFTFIFNLIWTPVTTFGISTPTMPLWAEIVLQIITYFISTFVSTYLLMTFAEFYFERKPLEIYNEDYVKPETNEAKYKKIIAWMIVLVILLYLVIGFIIYFMAANVTNNAIQSLDMLTY